MVVHISLSYNSVRLRMSWFWTIIFLSFTFNNIVCESKHQKKLPSAVVVGKVYCDDTCFYKDFSKSSHFISGASIAVECQDNASSSSFRKEVKTNKHGKFQVHLPFSLSKHIVKKIKLCSVQLIRSSELLCDVPATATSSTLNLKSRKQGTLIFSAGFFTFTPSKQPEVCDKKPFVKNSINSEKSISNPNDPIIPPIHDPQPDPPKLGRFLPPLPNLPPLPELPPLPPLPGIPFLPPRVKKENEPSESFKPLKQPKVFDKRPIVRNSINSKKSISNPNDSTIPPSIQDPQPNPPTLGRFLPPLPQLPLLPQLPNLAPLPELPRLPALPGFPFLPPRAKKESAP